MVAKSDGCATSTSSGKDAFDDMEEKTKGTKMSQDTSALTSSYRFGIARIFVGTINDM